MRDVSVDYSQISFFRTLTKQAVTFSVSFSMSFVNKTSFVNYSFRLIYSFLSLTSSKGGGGHIRVWIKYPTDSISVALIYLGFPANFARENEFSQGIISNQDGPNCVPSFPGNELGNSFALSKVTLLQ